MFYSTIDGFLEDEAPFNELGIELRKKPLEPPMPLNEAEKERAREKGNDFGENVSGFEYALAYTVVKDPINAEFEHPVADVNFNVDDLGKFEAVVMQQVGNILARHMEKYPNARITLKIFEGQERAVDLDLIKELGGNAKAPIYYVTTRSSMRPYEAPPRRIAT